MIWRIRTRGELQLLNQRGVRFSSPRLWCKVRFDDTVTPPRVAFSISRAVGPATTRNRLRRRLRALLAEADLGNGWWLVGARPQAATLSYARLRTEVETLIERSTAS